MMWREPVVIDEHQAGTLSSLPRRHQRLLLSPSYGALDGTCRGPPQSGQSIREEFTMSTESVSRRTVLQTMLMGAAGVAVSACGGGGDPAPTAAMPEPAPAPAPPPVASVPEPAAAPAGPLPLLSPSDPAAVSLKYTTDASQVDATAAPTFVKGQACANCIQYQGAPGESHGPCTIFAGKAVAATGWCMAYVKKA
jgi:hypothetical protein